MIELANIHKSFGPKHVLQGIDLTVEKGESLVVIGGSGSGKSVMMKSIIGLLRPEQGSIRINGVETIGISARQRDKVNRQFGMLFQHGALLDSLPVWQNVAFAVRQQKNISTAQARAIAQESLSLVGLGAKLLDLYPADLSGGMHKCVGLARAIAAKPPILFFDEPTTGLDPVMTDIINHLIRDCVRELGATTLTITHDMSSARIMADKVAFLYQGKIIWVGTEKEMTNSDDPFLHQFVNGLADGPIATEGVIEEERERGRQEERAEGRGKERAEEQNGAP
ncbi:MAG: ATP-binding cassette domain-containing protein [Alphaproteobacteria bacterium]|nr:ATP-binding cassette domain-containing protein [Alphaproteobacteria bacterium]